MNPRSLLLGLVAVAALFEGRVTWLIFNQHMPGAGLDVAGLGKNPFLWVTAIILFGLVYLVDARWLR